MTATNVAILGGGMTGLVLALRLATRGDTVTVFDQQREPGGLSVAADYGDFAWDRFYHVIAGSDRALLALLDELGLGGDVRWQRATQGIFLDAKVRPLVGPKDLLALPGLSLLDKFRLGMFALTGHRPVPDAVLDGTTAAAWATARCGTRAFTRFWRPLLAAKLGNAAPHVHARFLHATFTRLRGARGAGHQEQFGYVQGGYRRVLDVLVARLRELGVKFCSNARVATVRATGSGVLVRSNLGEATFARAIATMPNPQLAEVLDDLQPSDRARLAATPYLGVACTVVVGRTPLSGHYILNLCDDGLALTGIIETTAVVDRAATAGHTLVYLPRYATSDSELFEQSDDAIAERALEDLARVFPATTTNWLLHRAVHRARLVQPLRFAGAPSYAPPRTVVEGRIHCVSNACLPPGTLNNNDCVAMVNAAAREL